MGKKLIHIPWKIKTSIENNIKMDLNKQDWRV